MPLRQGSICQDVLLGPGRNRILKHTHAHTHTPLTLGYQVKEEHKKNLLMEHEATTEPKLLTMDWIAWDLPSHKVE